MSSMIAWWGQNGNSVADLATTLGLVAAGLSAIVAAVTLRRMRMLQIERNTFEFMESFQRDERFVAGQRLLDEFRGSDSWPRYYDLRPEQRLSITALMNAYERASGFGERGFIDEGMFVESYGWFLQTHWRSTERYVMEVRQHSVGGDASFSGFERLKKKADERDPARAARFRPK